MFTDASGLGTDTGDVAVFDPDTGARRTLVERASAGWVAPTGHLVFVRDGDLWAVRFDPDSLDVRGEPVPIEQGLRVELGGAVQFAACLGEIKIQGAPFSALFQTKPGYFLHDFDCRAHLGTMLAVQSFIFKQDGFYFVISTSPF